jgi:quercetin dioxygenase-like cupin family protein
MKGLLLAAAFLAAAAAQQAPTFDPDAIPVEKEPHHHLVFTNAFVRVVDVRLPPGYQSLKHSHLGDNVTITIAPGRDDPEGRARVGRVGFSNGRYSHVVTNSGPLEQHYVNVEILTSGAKATDSREIPAHKLELENDKVRVYRVTLASGQSMAGHRHGHGWLAVTVSGAADPGAFVWHDAGASEALSNSGINSLEIVEVEPK